MNRLNDYPISNTLSLIPYLKCLSEAGFDANSVLKQHKLNYGMIQENNFVPSYIIYKLLRSISDKVSSNNIGIDAYNTTKLPNFIANIDILMNYSENPVDFFMLLNKKQKTIGSHFRVWIEVEKNTIFVCHQGSLSNPTLFTDQSEYCRTLFIIEIIKFYKGESWMPNEIYLNSINLPPVEIANKTKSRKVFIKNKYGKIPIHTVSNNENILSEICNSNYNIESTLIDRLNIVTKTLIEHEDINLSLMSDMFGCSNRTLQRILKTEEINFRDFIKQQKLEYATSLLNRDISISEIAHKLGYKDPANFTRSFKSYYGVAPSLFREKQPTNFKSPE